jgi:LPPG:FO 2-phospho-L-lactate transferase
MTPQARDVRHVVALAGGVGGARLVDGLDRALAPGVLTVIANTGDDFEHWGLHISPDLDTVMYTLAGLSPPERGWGISGDTFEVLDEAKRRGIEAWFRLGDRDLTTHLFRTRALGMGRTLTEVTGELCGQLEVTRPLLPMSDAPRPTMIIDRSGNEIAFQDWLVRARARPEVSRVDYGGDGVPTEPVLDALRSAELVIICPSNPYVSIDPILSLEGVRAIVREKSVVGVSPIVHGEAVKGPLASMMAQLEGQPASARAVAMHYEDLLDGFVVHRGDAFEATWSVLETDILIQKPPNRVAFAEELLDFAECLR